MKHLILAVVKILLAIFMVYGGIQHFVKPDFYIPFVPSFLPYAMVIVYISGLVEIVLGVALLLNKKYAKFGALGVLLLMILFLPIHIWDVFSENPAIGSHNAALIRLPVQFVLIALAGKVYGVLSTKKI
ncbi:DoxX family membrane protein [Maribacter polysiphoniae]|uniref:DoxX family membrane protein n=1 Tax=Maribacter polysiphoniae TaxID=429344 RepID=A0A316DYJ0_9FLAO|nr:DoxX family membrane protein [Maribacter polysiphoniae]MBD1262148.1 DoxX family membrane protein [Maribacter polysiphoniae]PWK21593.1 putative membrane protein [Maribacter polysiphoniae]